mmetsp:Transcript_76376/g.181646  ORF Transcript_76376/g.181646 Transcript_76376/m.181646 type:complete len:342 (+) Transcript_76376:84-1109(+)|eukprot:CAMPEP_0178414284 /NCGR_PEP_ID=MMETSP0689_2-20121128/22958_1 /TAXON_ID=160604 /ORGANISM="Amphidinium massartii, Strain CS-259" /LENGTH=341 /DNA_ID=CAMNT_0020035571 /DNA_START=84 /DNA_END=1109 /DNA_ORIENTATION=-
MQAVVLLSFLCCSFFAAPAAAEPVTPSVASAPAPAVAEEQEAEAGGVVLLQSSVESYRKSAALDGLSSQTGASTCQEEVVAAEADALEWGMKKTTGSSGEAEEELFPTVSLILRVLLRVGAFLPILHRLQVGSKNSSTCELQSADAVKIPKHQLVALQQAQQQQMEDEADPAALLDAIHRGNEAQCRILLQSGTKPSATDAWGCSALHAAASLDAVEIVQLLLDHGADIHALDAIDDTPLHLAARRGCDAVATLLVERGADMDALNMEGRTPLLLAGLSSEEGVCEFLMDRGASLGGIADSELPPTLVTLMAKRMAASSEEQVFVELGESLTDLADRESLL